ncbi:hypothetical protein K443DRAFT_133881 [Laccaria amethystina LaAM-08-1]|uniref:Uncharacterized protein n=1 Tax=Laccaria amethystina LaAM-08-1 TaxID=1095629 RepID=A0A0C9XI20_9AGAR|nr:hypothetical protein K443DRAFT_133881 [Laccaria amethystina LaAM-08-1]
MTTRKPYHGSIRKLVLAFDVGTTCSGISFCILNPGKIPEVISVTRFPGNNGILKVPTVIYYDCNGKVQAVGAETMSESVYESAKAEGWVKSERFKWHIRPNIPSTRGDTPEIPHLPPNKSVIEVLADFFKYLYRAASDYFKFYYAGLGEEIWRSVEGDIHFVLPHPNGWAGQQQAKIRKAAVLAQLIPDTAHGYSRISFVTEGEAYLHFAIEHGLSRGVIEDGEGVIIVDAGKNTIDLSAYCCSTEIGIAYEEIAATQCLFQGFDFVTINAKRYLRTLLANSRYLSQLEYICQEFDRKTKLGFMTTAEDQRIRFGNPSDRDDACGIRSGQIKLAGPVVASFFEPSVSAIFTAVLDQRAHAVKPITHVVMVGGFSSSDWLMQRLRETLIPHGFTIFCPEGNFKAVSNGAVSFHLDHFVSTRVARFGYGTSGHVSYNPRNPDHLKRSPLVRMCSDGGKMYTAGLFQSVTSIYSFSIRQNTAVSEVKEFRARFHVEFDTLSQFKKTTCKIECYKGLRKEEGRDSMVAMFTILCQVEADLSSCGCITRRQESDGSGVYYAAFFDLVLLFGLTEFKAQIAWDENLNLSDRSHAEVIYDLDDSI